jgi:putative MFS transporter
VSSAEKDRGLLRRVIVPRRQAPIVNHVLVEAELTELGYSLVHGPFLDYVRREFDATSDEILFRLHVPGLSWAFAPLYRRLLRQPTSSLGKLLPPTPLSGSSWWTLGATFWLTLLAAYCATLLGQTLAYVGPNLGASSFVQSVILAASRVDVVVAIPLARAADAIGRTKVLRWAVVAMIVCTSASSLAPEPFSFGGAQVLAKACATTVALVVLVMVAESVEREARAWALGFLLIPTALGAGLCAVFVATLGFTPWMWRVLYGLAALSFVFLPLLGRITEAPRYLRKHDPLPFRELARPDLRRRLVLVGLAAALINLFFIPASQFRNQFLRFDRHFSPLSISLYTIFTNIPAGIGVVAGSRMAETRGRRGIAGIGLLGGGILLGALFFTSGPTMIGLAVLGGIAGTFGVPAISVYGPELFPTKLRSSANIVATLVGRLGSVVGLVIVGLVHLRTGRYGPAIGLLAFGPIVLAFVVWWIFPETKGQELEEINPEDRFGPFDLG